MYIQVIENKLNAWSKHPFDGAIQVEDTHNQVFNNNYKIVNGSVIYTEPNITYAEKRATEYPAISEQLDMMYWDKINGTTLWRDKITKIKNKYPKK